MCGAQLHTADAAESEQCVVPPGYVDAQDNTHSHAEYAFTPPAPSARARPPPPPLPQHVSQYTTQRLHLLHELEEVNQRLCCTPE